MKDRGITKREIADEIGIPTGVCTIKMHHPTFHCLLVKKNAQMMPQSVYSSGPVRLISLSKKKTGLRLY